MRAARAAHAVLVPGVESDARRIAGVLGVARGFSLEARYELPRLVSSGEVVDDVARGSVVAVAGIARPRRFFDALRATGWHVTAEIVFRDHHWFGEEDLARVAAAATSARASVVITTEKDAVRLGARPTRIPWAVLPMRVSIHPDEVFREWILGRLDAARRLTGAVRV
jgi:tetraacyldisaccharide 4'-kinase